MSGLMVQTGQRQTWRTPGGLYAKLNAEFNFDFDPCPSHPVYDFDGLLVPWGRCNFVNPPYRHDLLVRWVARCVEQWRLGKVVVALLPVFADQDWWHDHVIGTGAELRWIRGRLSFDDDGGRPRFASVVVVWR